MDGRKFYTFTDLLTIDPSKADNILLSVQEDAEQARYALEDTSKRFSELFREKDAEISRLTELNAMLSEQVNVLKAALGDKNSIIRVRNSERFGRSTEKLQVFLSGILSGMGEKDKAGVMDQLAALLSAPSTDSTVPDDPGMDSSCNDRKEDGNPNREGDGKGQDGTGQEPEIDGNPQDSGKKKRGNPSLRRTAGFISRYFKDGTAVMFKIDGFTYTADEVKAHFGLDNIDDLVYLCSDIEVYETANVIPAMVLHTYHITLKLKRSSDGRTETLLNQSRGKLFSGASICSPSLLSYIITQKIVNGVTYYRIESILPGMGLDLKRSTFIRWVEKAGEMLAALPRYMMKHLKKCRVIQMDETFDMVNHDERGAGKASYYWMFRPSEYEKGIRPVIVYWFEQSRSAAIPEYYLYDYAGKVLSDGYVAYKTLTSRNGDIIRCLCWIHGRRMIIKSFIGSDLEFNARMTKENGPKSLRNLDIYHMDDVDAEQKKSLWGWICLLIIAEMFRIENTLKELTPEKRLAGRIREMKPLTEEFFKLIGFIKECPQVLANSYAKEAVSYFDNNQEALRKIFEDGLVPLSNNASERAAISLALGRNNWKSHDTTDGARTTALFYSLVETAKANGANPYLYIQYLLESVQDVWHLHEAKLLESDCFEEKKRRRLAAALKRLKKRPGSDPELDMRDLGEEPDLSFLECMMPWSEEFKAYSRQQESRFAHLVADAVTRDGLGKLPVSETAFKRILNAGSKNEREKAVRDGLMQAAYGITPVSATESEEIPSCMGHPAKDVILPEKRRPYCFTAEDGSQHSSDAPNPMQAMTGKGGKKEPVCCVKADDNRKQDREGGEDAGSQYKLCETGMPCTGRQLERTVPSEGRRGTGRPVCERDSTLQGIFSTA